ncbi:MAG: extracellular solute-binding protein [Chloroflexi bacterium]|nr:extracellular solute-binding protein [Chloroflexota bacterium]
MLLATACTTLSNPPRLATATAQAALPPTEVPQEIFVAAPTATAVSNLPTNTQPADLTANLTLTVWINETSAEHEAALMQMADEFSAMHPIDVELMLVSPMVLPDLVNTAVLSDTLPDIILHPLEYTIGWAERGVFNLPATTQAVAQIGQDTFDPAAIELLTTTNGLAAIPTDGFQQLMIYRNDWVTERNLNPPVDYASMFTFAESIYDLENNLLTGFVIPTESNLVTTHQAFEQIATANGCQLIDANGEVQILSPACQDATNFYFEIVHQFSPPGVQTDTSTQNAFLSGRTGMIMTSPTILPKLAGLQSNALPDCPECIADIGFLAQNSGITTRIVGNDSAQFATFGSITSLGITKDADVETAVTFIDFWFNDGYETWLSVESERKVPMRWGTSDQSRIFIDNWGTQSLANAAQSLTDIYGEALVAQLRDGIAISNRWGFSEGQGLLVTELYEELTFSIVLQEMLSGYFNSNKTIIEAYNRIIERIPNYPYTIDPEQLETQGD